MRERENTTIEKAVDMPLTINDVNRARSEWLASFPAEYSPADAVKLCDVALQSARAAVLDVADRFAGTVPPPPWPAPPELVAARERVQKHLDAYDVFARRVPNTKWSRDTSKPGQALKTAGLILFDQAAALVGKAQSAASLTDLVKAVPRVALAAATAQIPAWGWAVGLYLYSRRGRGGGLF